MKARRVMPVGALLGMKARFLMPVGVLLGLAVLGGTVRAGLIEEMARDTCEVNRWPCPYNCWDRAAARAPFPGMIENAWRKQNVLADNHFGAEGDRLSEAGQTKVRWILTEAPIQHRTVFVRRGETPQQTAGRMNAVKEYALKIAPEGGPPNILETNISPPGYPAGWPGGKEPTLTRKFQGYYPEKSYVPDRTTGGGASGGGSQ
jgi:hypothetical protein